jgi:hypothetical protein
MCSVTQILNDKTLSDLPMTISLTEQLNNGGERCELSLYKWSIASSHCYHTIQQPTDQRLVSEHQHPLISSAIRFWDMKYLTTI